MFEKKIELKNPKSEKLESSININLIKSSEKIWFKGSRNRGLR